MKVGMPLNKETKPHLVQDAMSKLLSKSHKNENNTERNRHGLQPDDLWNLLQTFSMISLFKLVKADFIFVVSLTFVGLLFKCVYA